MDIKSKIKDLEFKVEHSYFKLNCETFSSKLSYLKDILEDLCNFNILDESVTSITAPFQRKLKPWDINRSKKFIENIFLGYRTEIMLYKCDNKISILDGNHRLNVILDFLNNKFSIFDNVFYSDLVENNSLLIKGSHAIIYLKLYNFKTEIDACNQYIAINEHFTHTPEDIQIAKDFLLT